MKRFLLAVMVSVSAAALGCGAPKDQGPQGDPASYEGGEHAPVDGAANPDAGTGAEHAPAN